MRDLHDVVVVVCVAANFDLVTVVVGIAGVVEHHDSLIGAVGASTR